MSDRRPEGFPKLQQGYAVTGSDYAREQGKKGRKALADKIAAGEVKATGGFQKGSLVTNVNAKLGAMERWRRYYEARSKAEAEAVAKYRDMDIPGRYAATAEQAIGVVQSAEKTAQAETKAVARQARSFEKMERGTRMLETLMGVAGAKLGVAPVFGAPPEYAGNAKLRDVVEDAQRIVATGVAPEPPRASGHALRLAAEIDEAAAAKVAQTVDAGEDVGIREADRLARMAAAQAMLDAQNAAANPLVDAPETPEQKSQREVRESPAFRRPVRTR
jgi:hypothetical protein